MCLWWVSRWFLDWLVIQSDIEHLYSYSQMARMTLEKGLMKLSRVVKIPQLAGHI